MYNTAKFKSPGISDDQAEGCHVLCLSHSGKWIPLPRVVSVSYNKKLIHNVTQSEMQNCSQGSLQDCTGAIRILPLAPWWAPLLLEYPGSSVINLPVNMCDFGWCLTLWNRTYILSTSVYENKMEKKPKSRSTNALKSSCCSKTALNLLRPFFSQLLSYTQWVVTEFANE